MDENLPSLGEGGEDAMSRSQKQQANLANMEEDVAAKDAEAKQGGDYDIFGLSMPGDAASGTTWGRTNAMLKAVEEFPDFPPIIQFKKDLMESDQIAQWAKERGYEGANPDWLLRQFIKEGRAAQKLMDKRAKQNLRANRRAGIAGAEEAGRSGEAMPERTGGASARQATRAWRRGRDSVGQESKKERRRRALGAVQTIAGDATATPAGPPSTASGAVPMHRATPGELEDAGTPPATVKRKPNPFADDEPL